MTNEMSPSPAAIIGWIIVGLFCLALVVVGGCYVRPQYEVYYQRLAGQALLAHAQASKEIAVAEAKAKMESAELLAQAEVTRARGVAQANEIIGQSLKDNDAYLRYLWITEVAGKDIDKTIVYIPTEANLPLLEAGRSTRSAEKPK